MQTYKIKKQEDEWANVIHADIENKRKKEISVLEERKAKFAAYQK